MKVVFEFRRLINPRGNEPVATKSVECVTLSIANWQIKPEASEEDFRLNIPPGTVRFDDTGLVRSYDWRELERFSKSATILILLGVFATLCWKVRSRLARIP
jgi:hypothetical protein